MPLIYFVLVRTQSYAINMEDNPGNEASVFRPRFWPLLFGWQLVYSMDTGAASNCGNDLNVIAIFRSNSYGRKYEHTVHEWDSVLCIVGGGNILLWSDPGAVLVMRCISWCEATVISFSIPFWSYYPETCHKLWNLSLTKQYLPPCHQCANPGFKPCVSGTWYLKDWKYIGTCVSLGAVVSHQNWSWDSFIEVSIGRVLDLG